MYFRSAKFQAILSSIQAYVVDCNNLNSHIEELKQIGSASLIKTGGLSKTDIGWSEYQDASRYNYSRPHHKNNTNAPNVYQCSRSVCAASQRQPIKYLCKYFHIETNEETLAYFEDMLNKHTSVQEGRDSLIIKRKQIVESILNQIPFIICKCSSKKLIKKLGFTDIDLSSEYELKYIFKYVSPGGNSSMTNTITLDIVNLNSLVNYLNDKIKWRKSVAGQRALMTSALRKSILHRDGYRCKQCNLGIQDEPHLLLEIDHIIPLSKGGLTTGSNLQTLCWRCNRSKGAKLP